MKHLFEGGESIYVFKEKKKAKILIDRCMVLFFNGDSCVVKSRAKNLVSKLKKKSELVTHLKGTYYAADALAPAGSDTQWLFLPYPVVGWVVKLSPKDQKVLRASLPVCASTNWTTDPWGLISPDGSVNTLNDMLYDSVWEWLGDMKPPTEKQRFITLLWWPEKR